jgi:hypothetical protein
MSPVQIPSRALLAALRRGSTSTPSFNPLTDIPDLYSYYDVAMTSGYSTSGGGIITVNDMTGNGRNLVANQTSNIAVGTGINGLNSLLFTPANIGGGPYVSGADGVPSGGDYTYFAVIQMSEWSAGNIMHNGAAGRDVGLNYNPTFGVGSNIGGVNGDGDYTSQPYVNKMVMTRYPMIVSVRHKVSTQRLEFRLNGVVTGYNPYVGSAFTGTDLRVGAWGNDIFNGKISAFGFCSSSLSDADLEDVEGYLAARYNIYPILLALGGDSRLGGQGGYSDISGGTDWYLGAGNYNTSWQNPAFRLGNYCYQNAPSTNVMVMWYPFFGKNNTTIDSYLTTTLDATSFGNLVTQAHFIGYGGVNDSGTASQIRDGAYTIVANRKATGKYTYVGHATIPVAQSTVVTTKLLAANALITDLSNADFIVPAGETAHLSADGDYNDTAYYNGDKLHLVNAGSSLMGLASYNAIHTKGII